jgi:hypothetical protein
LVFSHPENVVSQWVTEWGLPVAFVTMGAIAYALRPKVVLARADRVLGAWAALVALAIQNLVDFSSEVPGIVIAAAVCAALIVGGRFAEVAQDAVSGHRKFALTAVVAGVLAACLASLNIGNELLDERIRLRTIASDSSTTDATFEALLRGAMSRHPAEPYFAYLLAARRQSTQRGDVMPAIERVFERANVYGPAHLVLARALRKQSPSQARLEYRLASEQEDALGPVKEWPPLILTRDDALELAPANGHRLETLDAIARTIGAAMPSTRWQLDTLILEGVGGPELGRASLRRASDLLEDVSDLPLAPWCGTGDCTNALHKETAHAEQLAPTMFEGYVIAARALVIENKKAEGLAHLQHGCELANERTLCLTVLANMAVEVKSASEAELAIEALVHTTCPSPDSCAAVLMTAANLEDRQNNSSQALVFMRRAAAAAPARVDLAEALALRASSMGLHSEALQVYEGLALSHPDHVAYANHADEERALIGTHRLQ